MVSSFITDRIDNAHALIDQGSYDQAVELLKNIKFRVHEEGVVAEIETFEKEHDKKLEDMIKGIQTSSDDPLRKQHNELKQWEKYSHMYLRFYDNLTKHHDV